MMDQGGACGTPSNPEGEGNEIAGAPVSDDGIGPGAAMSRTGASEAIASSSSDTDDSDSESNPSPLTISSSREARNQREIATVLPPQKSVTVLNFGTISLDGTTSGIEVGNKTEYLGPVTVQQIVHGGVAAASPEPSVSQAAHRRRPPWSQGSVPLASEGVPQRTGLVLRGSPAVDGQRERWGKKVESGLLWKHLLGRKVDTATWLPVALLSCITLIAIIIDSIIFSPFHSQREAKVSSSPTFNYQPLEDVEITPIPPRSRKNEALPNLHQSVIIPRRMWHAKPPKEYTPMEHPVSYVIISHTATEPCNDLTECLSQVLLVQRFHVESRHWSDIGYNFLVGGDGNSYEGRGWEYVGAHAKGYNAVSIGISFIGTFSDVLPPPAQIRACKLLIKEGVSLGKIASDYKLIAHRQVSPTESPGEKLYQELQNWEHWSPEV